MERPTGAWRLVRGKILRAPNWAARARQSERERGESVSRSGFGEGEDGGVWELMVKGAFQVT